MSEQYVIFLTIDVFKYSYRVAQSMTVFSHKNEEPYQ